MYKFYFFIVFSFLLTSCDRRSDITQELLDSVCEIHIQNRAIDPYGGIEEYRITDKKEIASICNELLSLKQENNLPTKPYDGTILILFVRKDHDGTKEYINFLSTRIILKPNNDYYIDFLVDQYVSDHFLARILKYLQIDETKVSALDNYRKSQEKSSLSFGSKNKNIKTLENHDFKLDIETQSSNDTLDIIDYKNDFCSSPIVLNQELSFFEKDKLIRHYKLPIKIVKKTTITKNSLNTLQTPIYELNLAKTSTNDYYIINGSDCCNGSACPEFTGIYTMQGKVIYEGLSTEKQKILLRDILKKYKIDINNPAIKIKVDEK